MDTSVSTSTHLIERVSNLSLMQTQSNIITLGGFAFMSGIILYSFGVLIFKLDEKFKNIKEPEVPEEPEVPLFPEVPLEPDVPEVPSAPDVPEVQRLERLKVII